MKTIILSIITTILINNSYAQNATFTDHGFVPEVGVSIISEFQTAVYNNGDILIATTNGVWKNNIATQLWANSGLQDKTITFIYKHPTIPNKIYAGALIGGSNSDPLFISNDGGINWIAANNAPETFSNIVARPDNPNHLYAGTYYGFDFMISTDGGNNWEYYNNGSGGANVPSLSRITPPVPRRGSSVCQVFSPCGGRGAQVFMGCL